MPLDWSSSYDHPDLQAYDAFAVPQGAETEQQRRIRLFTEAVVRQTEQHEAQGMVFNMTVWHLCAAGMASRDPTLHVERFRLYEGMPAYWTEKDDKVPLKGFSACAAYLGISFKTAKYIFANDITIRPKDIVEQLGRIYRGEPVGTRAARAT